MNKPQSQLINLVAALHQSAQTSRQRRGLILSGDRQWCLHTVTEITRHLNHQDTLWITSHPPEDVEASSHGTALKRLGSEIDLLIYDAHNGFDADSFGATSGLIRGGGLLLLLTPPLPEWPGRPDPEAERFFKNSNHSRFIQRFISVARQAEGIITVCQKSRLPEIPQSSPQQTRHQNVKPPCRTKDQERAVTAITTAASIDPATPCVLISDRGRGKSSALGIAAAQLLQQHSNRILVTGPRLNSVEPVFQHAARLLPGSRQQRGLVEMDDKRLEYIAADELINTRPDADMLLVDEAAAIPAPMLATLLRHYQRIAFATTVHGYEGTGRGFSLRFNKVLDQQTPGWQQVRLQQPIRWAENDPLEQFVFDALLLNATIATEEQLREIEPASCHAEIISQDQLMQDERLLSQVFGLLVLAHYRTRPNDLRQLLDSPDLNLYIMRQQQHVVGVALAIEEGGIETKLAQQIYQGKRRLQGQLLPQSLAFHAGMIDAPSLNFLRIMRIAIHPAMQGQGLGTKLIQHIIDTTDSIKHDCIGTSFGITTELLNFWEKLGFTAIRLGVTREHSSGTYSLLMLRPLSAAGRQLTQQAEQHMRRQLPLLLSDALKDFDVDLAKHLSQPPEPENPELGMIEWQDAFSFAHTARGYEFCISAITKLARKAISDPNVSASLDRNQLELLNSRVLQQLSWARAVAKTGLRGRGEAIDLLRASIKTLIKHYCPPKIRTLIQDLINP